MLIGILVTFVVVSGNNGDVILKMFSNEDKIALLSAECRRTLEMYVENMESSVDDDLWALKMWDASSKIPVGLISYNFGDMGSFDQCVGTTSVTDNIMGKYCLGSYTVTESVEDIQNVSKNDTAPIQNQIIGKKLVSLMAAGVRDLGYTTWALCIPSNCSDDDALNIMRAMEVSGIHFEFVQCQTTDDIYPELTRDAIIGIIILSTIFLTMVLSTCYDLSCRSYGKEPAHLALIAFSVYTNGGKLFRSENNHGEFAILNGMRFLSMMWILVSHVRFTYNLGHVFNSKDAMDLTYSFFITILLSSGLPVNTFLMIGGVLVSYLFFKRKQYEGKFNVAKYYLHRYLRLTPCLAGFVLISATLLRYMGSGPEWKNIDYRFGRPCRKYWWSTLLYVQNYVNVDDMCVSESWYLDVDMQLYLFSPLILFLLNKRPKAAIALLVLASFASIAVSFGIAYDNQLTANPTDSQPFLFPKNFFNVFYYRTHCRAAPWLMGMILGYFLSKDNAKSVKIPKVLSVFAWIFCFVMMIICVFGGHTFIRSPEDDRIGNAFFVALQYPVWSICLGWMIWACVTNRGGVVSAILSYPILQFFNKFTYCIYLLHMTIASMIVSSQRVSFYYSVFNVIYCSCSIFLFSFGLSIIWVLAFESPVIVLEKILWNNIS